MEKNEESLDAVKEEKDESKAEQEKETESSEKQKEDKPVKDNDPHDKNDSKDISAVKVEKKEDLMEDKEETKADRSNNSESAMPQVSDLLSGSTKSDQHKSSSNSSEGTGKSDHMSSNSNKSNTTHTTPTTTTSHLYSVLMAPLDGHSPYRDNILRFTASDADSGPRKRMRMDTSPLEKAKPDQMTADSGDVANSKTTADTNSSVGMDLTKNQKKKQKKKRRKHLLNKLEVQRAKDFIYSSENEQFSVEKLRTMIEDVTEFLDAIWDVYCSEARLKGESVEEDGYKVAAALKCLSSSGEGSWGDLQLLSRAKSVLVLRSKHLAASTIARVESELGYDADVRNFIVRMLKFWMGEVVTKG